MIDPDLEKRDILESEIPRDVLDILLKDRTTGKNILWMTDSYEHLESIFDIKMGYTRSNMRTMRQFYLMFPICHAVSGKLTWTHYRTLITVENEAARQYYFEEAVNRNGASAPCRRQNREDIPHLARPPKEADDDTSISTTAIGVNCKSSESIF